MSRVLLTGATGLIGRFLCDQLISDNQHITAIQRNPDVNSENVNWREGDITDPISLAAAMEGVDTVVHAAAMVSFQPGEERMLESVNVGGTRNVVNACLKSGVKRLVYMSSVSAIGRYPGSQTVDESAPWDGGRSPYGKTKYLAELEVFRGQEEGLEIAIANPTVVLAPGALHRSTGRLFQYALQGRPFYTDGLAGCVDVRDVARVIGLMVNGKGTGERYLLNAEMITWRELFSGLALRFGTKPPWIRIPPKALAVAAAMEKIRSVLTGQEPLVTADAVRLASEPHSYDASKSVRELGFTYTPLQDTLDWVCAEIRNQGAIAL
ncbi:MAG: NAD-dependent epimerase/dehydratase family protein [Bacteroidota bacterium]